MATISHIESNDFISSVEAGKQFGYTNDYIARLAREKRIIGKREGRQWYVDPASFKKFLEESEASKKAFAEKVRVERKQERAVHQQAVRAMVPAPLALPSPLAPRSLALLKSGIVLVLGAVVGSMFYLGADTPEEPFSSASVWSSVRDFAVSLYHFGEERPVSPPSRGSVQGENGTITQPEEASGLVVVPESEASSTDDIRKSFSDDVMVTPDKDGQGGLIQPMFKKGAGEAYRYLVVPMHIK